LRAIRRGAALAADEYGDTLIRFHIMRATRWDQLVFATFDQIRSRMLAEGSR
jgi:hypothetical protein